MMNTISGRRKEATAVVRLKKGTGVVTVNKKSIDDYFGRDVAKMIVRQPLVLTKNAEAYDVDAKVQGGGSFGQAGAIRLAISKALLEEDPELRAELKKAGYLTRDSRVKERKKVGLKKARKSPQFSKR
jgi:small subunit ribosomal protein S9